MALGSNPIAWIVRDRDTNCQVCGLVRVCLNADSKIV